MRRVIADPDSPDPLDPIANNTHIMKSSRSLSLHMDMNATSAFACNFSVYIMDMAVGNVNMAMNLAGAPGQHIDAKQSPLIIVGAVGVGDLNPINLPELHVLQENTGRVLRQRINDRPGARAIGLKTDRSIVCSTSPGSKHAIENCSPLKGNSVTGPEFSLFVQVEVGL
jgi:hypothetical protein